MTDCVTLIQYCLAPLSMFFHKTGCARQFDSKLSLRSLALFLYKTGCARQSESKLSLRSLALFLYKTGCARQSESKLSLRSLALFFNKRDGILRILHRYSSRCMSGRFVTAVFTCLWHSVLRNGAETARDLCLTSLSIVLCGMCGGTAFRRAGDSGHMLRSA